MAWYRRPAIKLGPFRFTDPRAGMPRHLLTLGVIFTIGGVLVGCGSDDGNYFAKIGKSQEHMQQETQRIFGEGQAVLTCDQAARRGGTAFKTGCKEYIDQMSEWADSLSDLRTETRGLTPPARANSWHRRYLQFLDDTVFATASGVDAFRKGDYIAFASVAQQLSGVEQDLDALLRELDSLQ
jgi:hypothetical protein